MSKSCALSKLTNEADKDVFSLAYDKAIKKGLEEKDAFNKAIIAVRKGIRADYALIESIALSNDVVVPELTEPKAKKAEIVTREKEVEAVVAEDLANAGAQNEKEVAQSREETLDKDVIAEPVKAVMTEAEAKKVVEDYDARKKGLAKKISDAFGKTPVTDFIYNKILELTSVDYSKNLEAQKETTKLIDKYIAWGKPDMAPTEVKRVLLHSTTNHYIKYGSPSTSNQLLENTFKDVASSTGLWPIGRMAVQAKKYGSSILNVIPNFISVIGNTALNIALREDFNLTGAEIAKLKQVEDKDVDHVNIPQFVEHFTKALNKQMKGNSLYKTSPVALESDLSVLLREPNTGALPENITSAIALSALNWLGTRASDSTYNDDAMINEILGQEVDAEIHEQSRNQLTHMGLLRSSVEADLGKDIRRQLNIKMASSIDGRLEPKLELALGKLAINTMAFMGQEEDIKFQEGISYSFLVQNSISSDNVFSVIGKESETAGTDLVFVKIAMQDVTSKDGLTNHQIPSDDVMNAVGMFQNKVTKSLFNKLFSIKSFNELPSAVPVTYTNPKMKGSINDVSKHVMKGVKNQQSKAIYPKKDMVNLIRNRVSRSTALLMYGYNDDPSSYHHSQKDAVKGKNSQLEREFDYFNQYMDERGMDPYYVSFAVWKNSRMGEKGGTISMQNSKMHRHQFRGEDWEVQIDLSSKDPKEAVRLLNFKLAVAEALGYKVDANLNNDSIMAFEDRINHLSRFTEALEILRKAGTEPFTPKEEKVLLEAVDAGGEAGMTLDGLVAAAAYMNARDTGGKFTTDIGREVDGKTNGYATSTLQLAKDPDIAKKALNRAGYYFDGDLANNFAEFINQKGTLDTYQTVALNTQDAFVQAKSDILALNKYGEYQNVYGIKPFVSEGIRINANDPSISTMVGKTVRALDNLLPPLVDINNAVLSFGRKIAKDPVMIGNYGAGLARIAREVAEKMYQELLSDMVKVSNSGNLEKIEKFIDDVNAVFSGREFISEADKQSILNKENKLSDIIIEKEHAQLYKDMVASYLGKAISIAMEKELSNTQESREAIVNSVKLMGAVFKIVFDKKLAAFVDKGTYPDKIQMNGILESIRDDGLLPGYAHATSDGYSEFLEASETSLKTLTKEGKVQQEYANGTTVNRYDEDGYLLRESKVDSSTNSIKVKEYGLIRGIGSAVMGNLSIDGNTQADTMQMDMMMVNVHDALQTSLDNILAGAQNNNDAYHRLNQAWSFTDSVNKHLENFTKEVTKFNAAEDKQLQEYIKELKLEVDDKADLGLNVTNISNVMDTVTKVTAKAREEIFSTTKSAGQYVNEGSEGHPNQEKITSIESATDDMFTEQEVYIEMVDWVGNRKIGKTTGKINQNTKDQYYLDNKDMIDSYTANLGSELGYGADNMTSTYADKLDSVTAPVLFDDLAGIGNKQETAEHEAYLKSIVDDLIVPALDIAEEIEVVLGTSDVDRNIGSYDPTNKVTYVGATENVLHNNTDMSAQEVAVHEWLHAVLSNSINNTTYAKRELERLFDLAKANIVPEDFLTKDINGNPVFQTNQAEEEQAAQDRYDYIFNNPDGNQLHEFVSIGLSNEQFIKALSKIDNKLVNKVKGEPFLTALHNAFLNVLDWIVGAVRKSKGKTVNAALLALAKDMSTVSSSNMNTVGNFGKLMGVSNTKTQEAISRWIVQPLNKYAHGRVKMSTNKVRKTLDAMIGFPFYLSSKQFRKDMDRVAYGMGKTKESFIYKLAYGEILKDRGDNSHWMKLMNEARGTIDKPREEVFTTIHNQIHTEFNEDGKPTDKDYLAMNSSVLKTDLQSIMDKYSIDEIIKLLREPKEIAKNIKRIQKELEQFNYSGYYNTQAKNLGHYMALGTSGISMQALNAYNIANLQLVPKEHFDINEEGDMNVAEDLIDELATLYALSFTEQGNNKITANFFESESANGQDENGMSFMVGMHKSIIEEARTKLFNDDKVLMVKGYTHENYDANRSFKTGTLADEKVMKEEGYVRQAKPIPKDDSDPNRKETYLYLNKDALVNSTVSGIFSTTSMNHKGTDLTKVAMDGYTGDDKQAKFKESKSDGQKMYTDHLQELAHQLRGRDTTNLDSAHAIPIASSKAGVTGFRYMMSEANKVQLLNKKDMAHKVLGRMQGNIIDKVGTEDIGMKVLLEAKREYDQNYLANKEEFTYVGKDAEGKYREMWQLLPEVTRRDMQKIWKDDGIYVRTELLDIVFGYRKLSIADNPQLRAFSKAIRITENVVQEIVRMAKSKIVILEPAVLTANVVSNTFLLMVKGVPIKDIIKNSAKSLLELRAYKKDYENKLRIENKIKAFPNMAKSTRANYDSHLARVNNKIDKNPVKDLIEAGVFQSIVEDIDPDQLSYVKSSLETGKYTGDVFEKIQDNMPGYVKDIYDVITINQNTKGYKALLNATQYSDFVARYTLFEHQTKNENVSKKDALVDIVQSFINYDIPQHRKLQYVNDIGAFMYTKFFFRIQRIIFQIFKEKPVAAIGLYAGQRVFGDIPDIGDTFLPTADMVGRVTLDPTNHLDDAFEMSLFNYLPFFSWFD